MKQTLFISIITGIALLLLLTSCQNDSVQTTGPQSLGDLAVSKKDKTKELTLSTVKVFATGFNNPRGLKFGPDGFLYVAEGGMGGTDSTIGICPQVIPPVGPYKGGMTARISKVSSTGVRTTVVDHLPSSQTSPLLGSLISGVADVAFIDNTLYALLAGAGCSHGISGVPNGVIKVNPDGTWNMFADLSAYQQAHPVAQPEADDFEPDGTWYSMVSVDDDLYAVEPNHGELVRISKDGGVSRVIDISASQGHIVPTAVAYQGNFFVGNLHPFPIIEGSSKILKITPSGKFKVWATGFTTILGITFDHEKRMYVLENTTGNPEPTPNTGMIIRVDHGGKRDTIAMGLFLPTALTFGPDGKLYVSNIGFGPPPIGLGQILQIDVPDSHGNDHDMADDDNGSHDDSNDSQGHGHGRH